MGWHFTDDVEEYAEQVGPFLALDPVHHTVPLTVLDALREGRMGRFSAAAPLLLGWYVAPAGPIANATGDRAVVGGAILMTPPFDLLLAAVPHGTTTELVTALRAQDAQLPGASGDVEIVDAFTAAWLNGSRRRAEIFLRMRLYELDRLKPPSPMPAGKARLAVEDDTDLVTEWFLAFQHEVGGHETDVAASVRDRIADGRMWLWEDESGEAVSLAARQRTAAGVARVGPVYTPPQHRRRGFAAGVTAVCTMDALEHADQVVLFTDLANPTSNSIYQQIGYRPITDRMVVRFVD